MRSAYFTGVLITGVTRISHGLRRLFFLPFVYSRKKAFQWCGNVLAIRFCCISINASKANSCGTSWLQRTACGRRCRSAKDDRQSDRYLKGNRDIVNIDVVFIYPVIIKMLPEKVLINDILFPTYMRCTALILVKRIPHHPAIIE